MNELVYRNLSEDAKRQICAWKYGGEYDLYNLPAPAINLVFSRA